MSIKKFHRKDCTGGACACPWRLDFRPQGLSGPHQRFQFKTRKDAERYQAEHRVKVARGEYIAPANIPTFGAVATEWMREKSDRHPATLLGWRTILRHLAPLDSLRLDRISVTTIESLRDDLLKKLAPKRVRVIMTIAAAVFKSAQRRGFATSNPAALAQRPRDPVVEVGDNGDDKHLRPGDVLDASEIGRLLEAAKPGLFKTLFATAASTGMRSEELGALKWGDVELDAELDAGRLFVRRSLSWTRDAGQADVIKPRFYPTKTKAGTRELPLPVALCAMLKAWKLACPKSADNLVFGRPTDGGPLRRSFVAQYGLWPACRRAGLRRCPLGVFRHSFASNLLSRGVAIPTVAALMGHSSPAITMRVYAHHVKGGDTGAAVAQFAGGFLSAAAPVCRARAARHGSHIT